MRLRGALLGAGNIALRSHAPQWTGDARLSREIEIVAVADLSGSNLAAARELLPEARPYHDAEELLEREQLDFCDICTPPFTHRRLIERAAARGVHIVCEKPLASTLADAHEIARTVRQASVVFRPCHQYHFSPQWQAVRRLLPRLGRVHIAEYQVLRTAANEGNTNWAPSWRTNREMAGGGILVDHGAHIFYQLRAALGDPRKVQAIVRRLRHRRYEVEDTALVTLDYGDRLAHVSLTWAAQRRAIHFRFVGEDGELLGDDERIVVHAARSEEFRFDDGMSRNSSHAEWYVPLLREFSAEVRGGGRSDAALDEAVHVTRVIERAYESARLGHALPLAPAAAAPLATAAAAPYAATSPAPAEVAG
ncbi:MAG TPA: Gfo/Idh/MocA family oxidoreductase, partial [Candidatus Eisenbacteria bacterium]|nr:Gfo/Idh/MocA family oxidoreductase [Candidatus Eisenbacteria bacterium]